MFIDTHAHLDDKSFDAIRDEVVAAAIAAKVERTICVGCTVADSEKCIRIAEQYDSISASVGIQPNYMDEVADGDWEQIVELAKSDQVVAIGETGLDHYWDRAPLAPQEDYFRRHVRLSQETGLPFIVHMRDPKVEKGEPLSNACAEHICRVLTECRTDGPLNGVMHSYAGNVDFAERFLGLGMYISFAGMVTFKKSDDLRAVAAMVPEDRLLIETDSPYLSPEPNRGKRPNQPAWVVNTAACLAQTRGVALEELAEMTTRNARTLFRRLPT